MPRKLLKIDWMDVTTDRGIGRAAADATTSDETKYRHLAASRHYTPDVSYAAVSASATFE